MVIKKKNDKSQKRSTSTAMSDVLKRQKKGTKAVERIVDKNIAEGISTRRVSKPKEKTIPLSDIAVEVAARRKAQDSPKKAKVASAGEKTAPGIDKKAPKATVKKADRPISAKRPALRKPAVKARHDRRVSVKVITLGAGLFKVAGAAVDGFCNAGKAVAGFAGSIAARETNSLESEARRAKEKINGDIKTVKRGARVKPQHKKTDAGPVSSALATATKITGKVAGGAATLGAGVGKAAGYVVTGALSAPVDIITGVIGIGASATGFTSRLLFGPSKSKGSKPEKRRRIPAT